MWTSRRVVTPAGLLTTCSSVFTLVLLIFCLAVCSGNYVITTPQEWVIGKPSQVCVIVNDTASPAGSLILSVTRLDESEVTVLFPNTTIAVPPGETEFCYNVNITRPVYHDYGNVLSVTGEVDGKMINHTAELVFLDDDKRTIVQTDKYLYRPTQTVHIRIVSFTYPNFSVSTNPYPRVSVMSPEPSLYHIARWEHVDNSAGLVHLHVNLIDEPELGIYYILVRTTDNITYTSEFEVKEDVLSQFEVVIETPTYVYVTNTQFNFSVCAMYSHGEAVQGNLTVEVNNTGNRACEVAFNMSNTISGCKNLDVYSKDIRVIDCLVNLVQLRAIVTEKGTGVQVTETVQISLLSQAITLKVLGKDQYMKPNLPYTIQVKAELPDKSPAVDVPVEMCAGEVCTNATSPDDGIITALVYSPTANQFTITAPSIRALMDSTRRVRTIEHFFSASNASLLIQAPEAPLSCNSSGPNNHNISVLFSSVNQTRAVITVQVMANREVKYFGSKEYELTASALPVNTENVVGGPPVVLPKHAIIGVINITFTLPVSASPVAKVLIWYTRDDGEVVSDSRRMPVERCLPNPVDLKWSVSQAKQGQRATIQLTSAPNSFCSFGVIDKSLELLKPQSDPFSLDVLFRYVDLLVYTFKSDAEKDNEYCKKGLESRQDSGKYNTYYTNYVDSLAMFEEAGLHVFSNLELETRPCKIEEVRKISQRNEKQDFPYFMTNCGGVAKSVKKKLADETKRTLRDEPKKVPRDEPEKVPPDEPEKVPPDEPRRVPRDRPGRVPGDEPQRAYRTLFPETWLWELFMLPSGGARREVTVPGIFAEWVGMAVCVHPQQGLGVSSKVNITTFSNFFVDLTLPPSIKLGEILPVKISVFNFHDGRLPVLVELVKSKEYKMVVSERETAGAHAACVDEKTKVVHVVRIKPSVVGTVMLNVTASIDKGESAVCRPTNASLTGSDSLIKGIVVEAEGLPQEDVWTRYVCSTHTEMMSTSYVTWEVKVPTGIVETSVQGWVTVLGNLLLPSIQNLGHLINLPSRCGEQNMLNLAVSVFILQYLNSTRQHDPETTKKLLNLIQTDYVREIVYGRDDGSYSGFGKADAAGSSWLTAFVLKSFAQASSFIAIDRKKLHKTLTWLLSTQNTTTGCFHSVGKVFNKCMRGNIAGQESPVPQTAYVVTALLETGMKPTTTVILNATSCVANDSSQDIYTMALKSYALALAKRKEAHQVLQQLTGKANVTKNTIHWDIWSDNFQRKALEVETASYALLAMVATNYTVHKPQIRKIVKWIARQRNSQGGFYTTQDTVVALQALSVYESHFYEGNLNMVATVIGGGVNHSVIVHEGNRSFTKMMRLTYLPAMLNFRIMGKGCLMVQSVVKYNVTERKASAAFTLTVKTEPDKMCVIKHFTACGSYLLPDDRSNMAILEVNLVSGYVPNKSDLVKITESGSEVKKYEVDGRKVTFYLDELTKRETCVVFRLTREVRVHNTKRGTVLLYDYYQPGLAISEDYEIPRVLNCI
ncbi:alpha-2-macroglobulin [Procambarus clarkii]|uniref:alpha-2-macroglobulin n=1 Tax=Procambarus clarkii TaxID=6728 RepID=UPI003743B0C9